MNKTRIKVCGICSNEDARTACTAGADAIGLVFYDKSPRSVSADTARDILSHCLPFVTSVGLFVNSSQQDVNRILSEVELDLLQFHGDEDEAFCRSFNRPYIKAVRVREDTDLVRISQQFGSARGLLLDSYRKGTAGGTGETFNWGLIPSDLSLPVILAGGLNSYNVADAIQAVKPWAVDVSSGVEASPGRKDSGKIIQFIQAVESRNR